MRNNYIENIYNSAVEFLTPVSLKKTYETMAKEAIKLVDGDYCSIFLFRNGGISRVYATNPSLSKVSPRKKGFTYQVYKTQKPIILNKRDLAKIHPELEKLKVVSDVMVPLTNKGRGIGVLTVLSKKKNFKKNDLELLKLLSPLGMLALKKVQLYNELEASLRNRDLFISLASHELKTPITTVYSYTQLLKKRISNNATINPAWIDTISDEILRLNELIKSLLEIEQIRTGKLDYNFEKVSIKKILKRSIDNFEAKYKLWVINIQDGLIGEEYVMGDKNKLIQVFFNILDNAAKNSSSSKPISVTLSNNDTNIQIAVQDQGAGIKRKDLNKIFESFYKASGNSKPGMGLGLYLTKQIVENHKGKIIIDSILKKGTSVKVVLPKLK